MIKAKALLICLLLPLGVGGASALLCRGAFPMYAALKKPPLSPPGWVFPAVWTALYLLMGAASYRVWAGKRTNIREALWLYTAQLAANFLWPLLFFGLKWYALALFCLAALFVLVLLTAVHFFWADRLGGALMLPYLCWVGFAGYLNAGVLFLAGG